MTVLERIQNGMENGKVYILVGVEDVTIGGGKYPHALWAMTLIRSKEKYVWPIWAIEKEYFGREEYVKFYELDATDIYTLKESDGINKDIGVRIWNPKWNPKHINYSIISPTENLVIDDYEAFYEYIKNSTLCYSIDAL